MKTGGLNGPWIQLEAPKPPPVADRYQWWGQQPPEISRRCHYWLRQFDRGFRPNRRLRIEGYDSSASWYGVWIWEYINLIQPLEHEPRQVV